MSKNEKEFILFVLFCLVMIFVCNPLKAGK